MPRDSLSDFTDGYIAAALWASLDDADEPLNSNFNASDIAPDTLAKMRADCLAFYVANETHIHCDDGPTDRDGSSQAAMAGHDFWLTRCGHGAGFWDGDWPEPAASALNTAARAFGNVNLYVGEDGMIHT